MNALCEDASRNIIDKIEGELKSFTSEYHLQESLCLNEDNLSKAESSIPHVLESCQSLVQHLEKLTLASKGIYLFFFC